jgi:predicted Zn-dependent protease
MEKRSVKDVNPALKNFYERAVEAAQRGDYQYAITTLLGVVQKAPAFGEAREKLRAFEKDELERKGAGFVGLRNMFKLGKIRSVIAESPVKAMALCEAELARCLQNVEVLKLLLEAAKKAEADFIAAETLELLVEFTSRSDFADELAELYRKHNQLEEVVKVYQRLVTQFPNNEEYKTKLQEAGKASGREKSRREDTTEQESLTLQLEGGIIRDAAQAKILIDKFNQQLQENESLDVRRKLANAYMVAGDYDAAAKELEIVQKALGRPDAQLDKLIEKAYLAKLDHNIDLLKKNPQAYENSEAQIAEFTKAREEFRLYRAQKRLRLMPNDVGLLVDLADLHYERGEYETALEKYDTACENIQKRAAGNLGAARCLAAMNKLPDAVQRFEKAFEDMLRMDRARLEAMYECAGCYERLGETEKAIALYADVVKNNVKFRDAKRKLEELTAQ